MCIYVDVCMYIRRPILLRGLNIQQLNYYKVKVQSDVRVNSNRRYGQRQIGTDWLCSACKACFPGTDIHTCTVRTDDGVAGKTALYNGGGFQSTHEKTVRNTYRH